MRYFSLFLGFFFAGTLGFFSMVLAQNATLYFVPSSSTVSPGQTLRVTVMADTKREFVNAVAAYFMYPADKLDALVVDRTGSVMTFFAEEQASGGRVDISGGTPTPGFFGIQKIASVDFRVKPAAAGTAILNFLSDAAIVRDSDNQNILSLLNSGKATFQIGQTVPPPAGGPAPTPTPTPTPTPPPAGGPEPMALAISGIKVEKLTDGSILLSWKTNEETRGQVNYGPTSQKDYAFSLLQGAFAREHSFVLSNVRLSEDYSLEIIGVDKLGKQVETERLALAEFLREESKPKPFEVVDGELEVGGFGIRFPLLIAFVLLPILVVLGIAFILFSRRG